MEIEYTPAALKDLKSIGHVAATKVTTKIAAYAVEPKAFANAVKKLKGIDGFRLRIGDYRVIFTENGVVMSVTKIGHRREIYE